MSKKALDDNLDDDLDDELIDLEDSDDLDEDLDEDEDRGNLVLEDEEDPDDLEEDLEEEEVVPPKPSRIPKDRFDEVIRQREEARDRSRWLEEQLSVLINKQSEPAKKEPDLPVYDFSTSEENYANLLIEGDFSKASKLRLEIDSARKAEMMAMISGIKDGVLDKAKSESNAVVENERFKNLIEALEVKHPYLNSSHRDYNEDAVTTVNTLMAGYQASGKSNSESLKLAVAKVTSMYNLGDKSKGQSLGKERTQAAGKKAAKAANLQPIRTKSSSSMNRDTDKVDVSKMNDRDFNRLTDKEKRILRGD